MLGRFLGSSRHLGTYNLHDSVHSEGDVVEVGESVHAPRSRRRLCYRLVQYHASHMLDDSLGFYASLSALCCILTFELMSLPLPGGFSYLFWSCTVLTSQFWLYRSVTLVLIALPRSCICEVLGIPPKFDGCCRSLPCADKGDSIFTRQFLHVIIATLLAPEWHDAEDMSVIRFMLCTVNPSIPPAVSPYPGGKLAQSNGFTMPFELHSHGLVCLYSLFYVS